jgi:error-prone DNA polymerase
MPRRKKEHRSLAGGYRDLDIAPGGPGDAAEIAEQIGSRSVGSSPRLEKRRTSSVRTREAKARVVGVATSHSPLIHLASPLRERRGETAYAELHCHSNYSFKEGASHTSELLIEAQALGMRTLAITDHDNMCGVMEFAQAAKGVGIKPIIGVEITLASGHHLTLLAENAEGYKNICELTTRAHMDPPERPGPNGVLPALDPSLLKDHAGGVICLSGCRHGEISELVLAGRLGEARRLAAQYRDWFSADNFFLELQQNLVLGDTERNRLMAGIGSDLGIPIVATNNAHYHLRERSHLNDVLVAIQHNKSLEETHRERRANDQFYLKSPEEMATLFAAYPEAIENTVRIADRCDFDLTSAKVYDFPDFDVPEGHTQTSWLRQLCEEAAVRKYGEVNGPIRERLDEEMALLEKHNLAGFVLQYYDIIRIAREVQEDLGLVEPGLPLEENPPGRGRGSSVAMLVGYLIGLSHIDPLEFGLTLDRFMPDAEMDGPPDIDLDFPRDIREKLILRVHERWGNDRAVLTGMISTYRIKGAIRDIGKALGLPEDDLDKLTKRVDGHAGVKDLPAEMRSLPEYRGRADLPLWQDLVRLALQLGGFPKYLAQHPGGMILSARPLSETVPLQRSAIDGRYICQWDKDSADDAGFVKIDFLALGALSQMNEALRLIEQRTEERVDLSRIDFEDPKVYAMLHRADTVGVFQVESAAQMQTIPRIRPKNLFEMAWEVGAVRPGVGVNDGVSMLIRRHNGKEPGWQYDHPLEKAALERTYGVPLYQDQLMELAVHVGGFTPAEGDRMRRAFGRRNRHELIPIWREKFMTGALAKGVPPEAAEKIFSKFHGEFQFPEAHAFAFGVTAYQMSWMKRYYPLEFFVGLFNQQPMGFYNLETLKEDAKRHGVQVLNPDVNRSGKLSVIDAERLRLGFAHVATVRSATADQVLEEREANGPFTSVSDFMARTGVRHGPLDKLVDAGTFDSLVSRAVATKAPALVGVLEVPGPVPLPSMPATDAIVREQRTVWTPTDENRRETKWEVGLRYRPVGRQLAFELPVEQDMVALPEASEWDVMKGEYNTLGLYPRAHLMEKLRPHLPTDLVRSADIRDLKDGTPIRVAGVVIRRQRPLAKAVFITLEDETGHAPLVIWPDVYERVKRIAREPILLCSGVVSHREGTLNVVVRTITPVPTDVSMLKSKDWG